MSILFSVLFAAGLIGPLDRTIVSPAWLQKNFHDPDIVIVEIGNNINAPHIPGAHFVAIDSIVKRDGWPPDELPSFVQLERAFGDAGVGNQGRIILYSSDPLWATRAWFTLDYLGQGDRVAILDGGYTRWTAEERPVATARFPYLPKTFTASVDATRVISLADVHQAMDADGILIDARGASEFYGLRRGQQVMRRGHIPGAHCASWRSNLTRKGSFRTPAELQAQYKKLIGKADGQVIVYCRTGMEATMPYFVLRSLGYNVVLFDGSYAAWAREKTMPVAKLSTKR